MPLLESTPTVLLLWALIGYLLGSIPFGVIVARRMGLGDPRDVGSGNIGATNVLRTGNKSAAALTLLLDAGKGAAAVLLARAFAAPDAVQVAAFMALIGHCYPIWLGFKGGKGVATFLGIMLAYAPMVGIGCCLVWLFGAAITRQSSMGSLMAAASSTFLLVFTGRGSALVLGIALTLVIFWRHRENIHRIRAGTEPKIGKGE